jgi:hypothetical protein
MLHMKMSMMGGMKMRYKVMDGWWKNFPFQPT